MFKLCLNPTSNTLKSMCDMRTPSRLITFTSKFLSLSQKLTLLYYLLLIYMISRECLNLLYHHWCSPVSIGPSPFGNQIFWRHRPSDFPSRRLAQKWTLFDSILIRHNSVTHTLIHSLIFPFAHAFRHSLTQSLIHLLIYMPVLFTNSCIHPPTHSPTHLHGH